MIREEYHNHVFEFFCNSEESASLNAGDKIPVVLSKMPMIKSIL
jgi:hypothetical protein